SVFPTIWPFDGADASHGFSRMRHLHTKVILVLPFLQDDRDMAVKFADPSGLLLSQIRYLVNAGCCMQSAKDVFFIQVTAHFFDRQARRIFTLPLDALHS